MILSHELSHIEVHTRIGEVRSMVGGVPAWFGEGLAVIISRDQRYLAFDGEGEIRCRHGPEGDLPTTGTEWRQQAGKGSRPLYAMAACRTLGWMKKNGGREGVLSTLARLGQGGAFSE